MNQPVWKQQEEIVAAIEQANRSKDHNTMLTSGATPGVYTYEGAFEHRVVGAPLRVRATIVVSGERAFVIVIACSAPPGVFESLTPRFRAIAGSFALGV